MLSGCNQEKVGPGEVRGGGNTISPQSLQVSSLEVFIEFFSEWEVSSEELHTTARQELVTSLYNHLASTGPGYIGIL